MGLSTLSCPMNCASLLWPQVSAVRKRLRNQSQRKWSITLHVKQMAPLTTVSWIVQRYPVSQETPLRKSMSQIVRIWTTWISRLSFVVRQIKQCALAHCLNADIMLPVKFVYKLQPKKTEEQKKDHHRKEI